MYETNEEHPELRREMERLPQKPRVKRRERALAKLRELMEKAKRDPLAYPKTSQLLASIAEGPENDRITIGELVSALDRRAFGVLLILGGVLCLVPLPPGFATLVAIPIFLFGFQLVRGHHKAWLPAALRRRSFRRGDLAKYVFFKNKWIIYIESFFRPRFLTATWLLSPYFVGAIVMALALYIALPIPFLGSLPTLALVLLAAALAENDGLLLVIGVVVAVGAMIFSAYLAAGTLLFLFAATVRLLGL